MLTINYDQLVDILPNIIKRTPIRLDWLKLNLERLKNDYVALYSDIDYYYFLAKHNAQVISMEHLLNNVLAPIVPITIIDGSWINFLYLFVRGEYLYENVFFFTRAEGLQDNYMYTKDEYDIATFDFYILLNETDAGLENNVRFWVLKYAPAGKNWDILII